MASESPEKIIIRSGRREYAASPGVVVEVAPQSWRGCSVMLFDVIPVRRTPPPYKSKTILIVRGGKTIRRMSPKDLDKLPLDASGAHVLSVPR